MRIPAWSKINKVMVNNDAISDVKPGEYLKLKRKWTSKDQVNIELDMRGRVEINGETTRYAAITRGPIVLARDSRLIGPSLVTVNIPVADNEGYIQLKTVAANGEYWMQFSAMFKPESYTETGAPPVEIGLCDYASAGNGKKKSVFEVWLTQLFSGRAE